MSILIKGMEMPKSCWDCFACHDGWCIINQKIEGHRTVTHSCPLIEVQTPHGRLIDAGRMISIIEDRYPKGIDLSGFYLAIPVIKSFIEAEPTVIEAEDDTDFYTKGHLHLGYAEGASDGFGY